MRPSGVSTNAQAGCAYCAARRIVDVAEPERVGERADLRARCPVSTRHAPAGAGSRAAERGQKPVLPQPRVAARVVRDRC